VDRLRVKKTRAFDSVSRDSNSFIDTKFRAFFTLIKKNLVFPLSNNL
jgi:hypothetical protein